MATSSATQSDEKRGDVLSVLLELLEAGQNDAILELVRKLLARNGDLERRVAELVAKRGKNEGISTTQLLLLLEDVPAALDDDRQAADDALRRAASLTPKTKPPPRARQPRLRKPPPSNLRRIDNPLAVPEDPSTLVKNDPGLLVKNDPPAEPPRPARSPTGDAAGDDPQATVPDLSTLVPTRSARG